MAWATLVAFSFSRMFRWWLSTVFIAIIRRSQEEWVCHPRGCEVVEVRFHDESLVGYLERSPLGQRLMLPRLP